LLGAGIPGLFTLLIGFPWFFVSQEFKEKVDAYIYCSFYTFLVLVLVFSLSLYGIYKYKKNLNFSEWVQIVLTAGENIPQAIGGFVASIIFLGIIVNFLTNFLVNADLKNLIITLSAFIFLLILPLLVILLSKPSANKKDGFEPKKVLIGALSKPNIIPPSTAKKGNEKELFSDHLCKYIKYNKIEKYLNKEKDEKKKQRETINKLYQALKSKLSQLNLDIKEETLKDFFYKLEEEPAIGNHTWYPLIKSVISHLVLNKLKEKNLDEFRIYLLTSAEVKQFADEFKNIVEIIRRHLEINYKIEVITPDKLDKCFLNGLDFNNVEHLELFAKKLSDDLLENGCKDEDISVHITSGTVPVSLILTFFAISEARQIEYIHQETKDLIVLPISPMTVFNLHASPKIIA
jgi:hypothetical protein